MSKYISGKELLKRLKLKPIELLSHIAETGIQPLTKTGKPIPPPDVRKINSISMSVGEDRYNTPWASIPLPHLNAHPYELIDKVHKMRGDLNTWQGFDFNDCIGGLQFDETEKTEILDLVTSDEVMFLKDSVFTKKSYGKGRRQPFTEHNQAKKKECRKFAYDTWKKERKSGVDAKKMTSVSAMVRLLITKEIAIRSDGYSYSDKQISRWISGIQRGTEDPTYRP